MKDLKQSTAKKAVVGSAKQRSYNEVVAYLDGNWQTTSHETSLESLKQLDKNLGSLAGSLNTVLVTGTNGKSLTIHYTTKILRKEGLSVGAFFAPHLMSYNERFALNQELVTNKIFTDLANEVIGTAEALDLAINSYELLFMMALRYFKQANVDVALLEVSRMTADATTLCNARVTAITRITEDGAPEKSEKVKELVDACMSSIKKGTHVVSANQSKIVLNDMETVVESHGGIWTMPIRKLAPLAYPFEQLHGRCAALAERICDIYINEYAAKDAVVLSDSLLTKTKGRRGRPTLEAKRQAELNPKLTIEQFWTEENHGTLPGRFELLEKEKPMIVLDNADNMDAFENLLLGVRLLQYKRPFKGLALILANNNEALDTMELLRALRYFFKKTSGHIFICPSQPLPGQPGTCSWNAEQITNDLKGMKVKAKACGSLQDALQAAQEVIDEQEGLIVVAGSASLVSEYLLSKTKRA